MLMTILKTFDIQLNKFGYKKMSVIKPDWAKEHGLEFNEDRNRFES